MQIRYVKAKKIYILIFFVSVLFLIKLFLVGFEVEKLIASSFIPIPFLYWWVIPYLLKADIEMPSWSFSLKVGKNDFTRFLFFILGISISIGCIFF